MGKSKSITIVLSDELRKWLNNLPRNVNFSEVVRGYLKTLKEDKLDLANDDYYGKDAQEDGDDE